MGISAAVDVIGTDLLSTVPDYLAADTLAASVVPETAAAVDASVALGSVGSTVPDYLGADTLASSVAPQTAAAVDTSLAGQEAAALGPNTAGIYAQIDPVTGAITNAGDLSEMGAAGRTAAAAASGGLDLSSIVSGAKTGSQLIGGLGQLYGATQLAKAAGQMPTAQQADPFSAYRPQYAAQLQNLMQNPNTVTSTPGYQFNLAQGLQAQQAQQAAQGRLVSGGALLQSQQFGQQLAGQTYQQQLATLAGLSGANQTPAQGASAASSAIYGQTAGQLGALQLAGAGLGLGGIINPLATLYANAQGNTPTA